MVLSKTMRILLISVVQICHTMGSDYLELDVTSEEKRSFASKEVNSEDTLAIFVNTSISKDNKTTFEQEYRKQDNITECSSTKLCQGQQSANIEDDKSYTTLINYPFSVSIQRKGAHYATGALIGNKWILSTAGDFYNIRETIKLYRARLGSVDCKNGGILVPIIKIDYHPSYVYGLPNFDLGLLRTAQRVEFTDYIRPIALSRIRTKVISAKFMVTYWPRIIVKGQALPPTAKERQKQNSMRVSTQRIIPHIDCAVKMYNMLKNATLHESALCLKPFITHHSPCLPDTGAPVVAEDGLWGITSGWTSKNCLKHPSPTVFTRVGSLVVRVWLDAIIDTPSTTDWNSSKDDND